MFKVNNKDTRTMSDDINIYKSKMIQYLIKQYQTWMLSNSSFNNISDMF